MKGLLNAIALCGLGLYLCFAATLFYCFVDRSLIGQNAWRVGADSAVYMDVADKISNGNSAADLLGFAQNLLLPAFIAIALKTTGAIALFNVSVFLISLWVLRITVPSLKWYMFLPIVLSSPTTFSALLTLNKEIFAFFSSVLVVRWLKNGSKALLLFLLSFSLVLRWEQAFVIFLFAMLSRLQVSPKRALLGLVILISILFPLAHRSVTLPPDLEVSSALIATLNSLEDHGFYFALALPKLFIALTSQISRWWIPFFNERRFYDLQTGLFVLGDQICFCSVTLLAWRKGLWNLSNLVAYFIYLYVVVFCAAPLNSPRYLYMIFVTAAIYVSSPEIQNLTVAEKQLGSELGLRARMRLLTLKLS